MGSMFKRAERKKIKLRMALDGPAGSGKTYSGLMFATQLGAKIAVIDTEAGSASKYEGYAPEGSDPWRFDVCELSSFSPSTYEQVIIEAGRLGYDVLLIDSLSHAWQGTDGALEQVSRKEAKGGNSFTAWKDVTPQQSRMIDAILRSPCHVIATMRTKTEYVLEEQTNASGKKVMVPKKVGVAPIQRQGVEYEFDVVCDLDQAHTLYVSKSRCPGIADAVAHKPGPAFMGPLKHWLNEGMEVPAEKIEAAGLEFRAAVPPIVTTATNGGGSGNGEEAPKLSYKERMMAAKAARASVVSASASSPATSGTPSDPPFTPDAPAPQAAAAPVVLPDGEPAAVTATPAPAVAKRTRQSKVTTTKAAEQPTEPSATQSNGVADGTATREQCDRLESLCERVELPYEARTAMLRKRGVDAFRSLSKAQADELIGKLLEIELGADKLPSNPRIALEQQKQQGQQELAAVKN